MIQSIPIPSIVIPPNRQRRDHDQKAHQDLIESIKTNGLLNAINLRFENNAFSLVAGERRLRAVDEIWELGGTFTYAGETVTPETIPYTNIGDLTPLEAEIAELEENTHRLDLSWQEKSAAVGRILEIRTAQAEVKGEEPPSIADIAEETKGNRSKPQTAVTRQEVLLSRHLDNPIVQKAKTRDEAFKALVREDTSKRNAALAGKIGSTMTSASHQLISGDCFIAMESMESSTFDIILTDPPYGMDADLFGNSNGGAYGSHFYSDGEDTVIDIMNRLPQELFRLTKPDAHAYIFCDIAWFHEWAGMMKSAGWTVFRTPLIWFKPAAFRAPWPEHGPQRKYETILYARKGDKRCTRPYGDVIECQNDKNLCHQAQKPVALFTNLLQRSVTPGDKILDPFCGTGPVFEAAHSLACSATGCEADQSAFGISATRIKNLKGLS